MARPQKKNTGRCGNSNWKRPEKVNIYLMQLDGEEIYKIGYTSNNPNERIRVIRHYFPTVKLIDYAFCEFSFEKFFHNLFQHKKVDNGQREWFRLDKKDVEFILGKLSEIKAISL